MGQARHGIQFLDGQRLASNLSISLWHCQSERELHSSIRLIGVWRDPNLDFSSDLLAIFRILKIPAHHESIVAAELHQSEEKEGAVDEDYVQVEVDWVGLLL